MGIDTEGIQLNKANPLLSPKLYFAMKEKSGSSKEGTIPSGEELPHSRDFIDTKSNETALLTEERVEVEDKPEV